MENNKMFIHKRKAHTLCEKVRATNLRTTSKNTPHEFTSTYTKGIIYE